MEKRIWTPLDSQIADYYNRSELALGQLCQLLRIPPTGSPKKYLGLSLPELAQAIKKANTDRDLHAIQINYLLIAKLLEDLHQIESYDLQFFHYLRKRLGKDTANGYRGTRFEISTASSLIKRGVRFRALYHLRSEPDFVLFQGKKPYPVIECSAPHFSVESTGSPRIQFPVTSDEALYKIESKVTEKSQKKYCGRNATLFLDITHLIYAKINYSLLHYDELRKQVEKCGIQSGFGAILLFVKSIRPSPIAPVYESSYIRCDSGLETDQLKAFLDLVYPMNSNVGLFNGGIPRQP